MILEIIVGNIIGIISLVVTIFFALLNDEQRCKLKALFKRPSPGPIQPPPDYLSSKLSTLTETLLNSQGWHTVKEKSNVDQNDVKLEFIKGYGKTLTAIIKHKKIGKSDLERLERTIRHDSTKEIWVVTDAVIDSDVRVAAVAMQNIRLFSLTQLIRHSYRHFNYVRWLMKVATIENTRDYNVPLEVFGESQTTDGNWKKFPIARTLDDHIEQWLNSTDSTQYLLLGDFGTGKTWFCLNLAYSQLISFKRKSVFNRFPIYIHLKYYKNCDSIAKMFRAFCKEYKLENLSFDTFKNLNEQGYFLFIIDGIDEFSIGNAEDIRKKVKELNKLINPKSKLLITSRIEFFNTKRVEDSLFLEPAKFQKLYIKPLSERKVLEFLKLKTQDADATLQEIKRLKLSDLATRPVMLDMIIESLKTWPVEVDPNVFQLYDHYTKLWIDKAAEGRGEAKGLSDNEVKNRIHLMQAIAWEMFSEHLSELHNESLDRISHIEGSSAKVPKDDRMFMNAVRGQTYLIADQGGKFFFAHKSFMEFFVAKRLLKAIEDKEPMPFNGVSYRKEKDWIFTEYSNDGSTANFEMLQFVAENDLDSSVLENWLINNKGDNRKRIQNGNIINLLRTLKFDFTGYDFSELYIENANFSRTDLTGANFCNSNLQRPDFTDATLNSSNFNNAEVHGSILGVRSPTKYVTTGSSLIATNDGNNSIRVFHATTFELQNRLPSKHNDSITNLAFSADDKKLASVGFDRSIILWDLEKDSQTIIPNDHTDIIYGVCFGRNSKHLITSDNSNKIRVTSVQKKKELLLIDEHEHTVYSVDYHQGAKAGVIASGSFDKKVGIWILDEQDDEVRLTNFYWLEKCEEEDKETEGHDAQVNHVRFSRDGSKLASCSNDKSVIIWTKNDDSGKFEFKRKLEGHKDIVWDASFSPDGKVLASSSTDGNVILWDLETGNVLDCCAAHTGTVWSLEYTRSGDYLVSGGIDGNLHVWETKTKPLTRKKSLPMQTQIDVNRKLNCKGMSLVGTDGFSTLQLDFLKSKGAIDE